jgi:hypothetical protein
LAELLVIRDAKATGRADCVPGEVSVVKPDKWDWSERERKDFVVIPRPDLTVEQAEAIYLRDAVPDAARAAERDEWQRMMDDRRAALAAAKVAIEATKDATERAAAKGFDDGTLLVDPLTPQEKGALDPAAQKVLTVERIVARAEQAAIDAAVADVVPPDPAKEVPIGVYPTRLRHLDLDALDALGDKATPLDVDLATITKSVR